MAGSTALIGGQVGFWAPARASAAAIPAAAAQPGTASADAALIGIVPQASSLSLTTSAGQSESAYNQNEDQATSATVDMGGLGVLLENSPVCGQVFLTQQRQPQPLTADSQDGSRTLTNDRTGNETVTVSSSPEYAHANTAPISQQIPGVLQVTGQTDTLVRYLAGGAQEADASVHADVDILGGLVSMRGLDWQAGTRSGAEHGSTASFSFGSVTLAPGGIPIALPSSDSEAQVFSAVNRALSTVGMTLEPPVTASDAGTGSVSITPLDLHFSGSPTDNTVLGPVAAQVPSVEQILAGQTADGSDCSQIKNFLGNMLTPSEQVFNLALASAQGAGGLDVDLGGATVSTRTAPDFANPFGSGGDTLGGSALLPGSTSGSGSPSGLAGAAGATSGTAAGNATGTTGTGLDPTAAPSDGTGGRSPYSPASARGDGLIRCVTSSPAGGGCWTGLGVVAGAGALAVGVALLAADLGITALPRRRRSAKRRSRRRVTA